MVRVGGRNILPDRGARLPPTLLYLLLRGLLHKLVWMERKYLVRGGARRGERLGPIRERGERSWTSAHGHVREGVR